MGRNGPGNDEFGAHFRNPFNRRGGENESVTNLCTRQRPKRVPSPLCSRLCPKHHRCHLQPLCSKGGQHDYVLESVAYVENMFGRVTYF